MAQDYAQAAEGYEKAAAMDSATAKAQLEKLPIRKAFGTRCYAEALRLQEALAARVEAAEIKREGRPGTETAEALNEVAWYALFARKFRKSLAAADRAHGLLPDDLGIEINRAHALMFLNTEKKLRRSTLVTKVNPSRSRVGSHGIPSLLRISPKSARRVLCAR